MKLSPGILLRGVSWTVAAYIGGQLFRFGSNVILTRLLAPELFGVIAIVYSVRTGIELMSDAGIIQNMVYNKNSDRPEFYNTAWTLQVARGVLLWPLSVIAGIALAHFYHSPILAYVLPIASLSFVLMGFGSTGAYLAQKRIQFVRLNLFAFIPECIASVVNVAVAFISPTIWALVFGGLSSTISQLIGSYFLVPGVRHRFYISREYAWQMLGFSKWIFLSSLIYFLSANFDSLYLGKAGTLKLLGVYGIARALSQQIVALVGRLNAVFVFPYIASSSEDPRVQLREGIAFTRFSFLLLIATALSLIASGGDLLVAVLYDERYQAAGWMLPILSAGAWLSILCSVNESVLLGLGKPSYAAIGNCMKLSWLLIALPLGFTKFGAVAAIAIIAASDLWRYLPVLVGQMKERVSFAAQDSLSTALLFGLIALWQFARWSAGIGFTPV